jgi:hypothetical protein
MAEPFPEAELKKVVRWIIEWAQEPEGAFSGELQIHIIQPEKKQPSEPSDKGESQ